MTDFKLPNSLRSFEQEIAGESKEAIPCEDCTRYCAICGKKLSIYNISITELDYCFNHSSLGFLDEEAKKVDAYRCRKRASDMRVYYKNKKKLGEGIKGVEEVEQSVPDVAICECAEGED